MCGGGGVLTKLFHLDDRRSRDQVKLQCLNLTSRDREISNAASILASRVSPPAPPLDTCADLVLLT